MKSTLFNMVMVLFVITLLASAGVGAVHMITEEPIAEARIEFLKEKGHEVVDFGTDSSESCDYPKYGEAVGRAVVAKEVDCGRCV